VFGWFAFRSRVTGVYLSIITQALTYALLLAFFRNEMGFGGNNGLTDFKDILGFDMQARRRAPRCSPPRRSRSRLGFIVCRRSPIRARQGAGLRARRGKPDPLHRLPGRALQAVRLRRSRR
jgi:hypothetical protein